VKNGAVLAAARAPMEQGQAEALVPLIERTMGAADATYAALDRIAVTLGPGSFTGVRVGLSTARALGLAAHKPVIGVSTFDVLAAAVPNGERTRFKTILAAIDTKRGDLYVQTFAGSDLAPRTAPAALPPADLAAWMGASDVLVVGDGVTAALNALPGAVASTADSLPDARILARLATARTYDPAGPLPLYVLPPKITLAPHGGKLRP
jgi:tRNA threonylcarbamoyladenosine biosynthesis protein TsaB